MVVTAETCNKFFDAASNSCVDFKVCADGFVLDMAANSCVDKEESTDDSTGTTALVTVVATTAGAAFAACISAVFLIC